MVQENATVKSGDSTKLSLGNLVLSARFARTGSVGLVIGCPGIQNLERELRIGDAVLVETPAAGVLEVRILRTDAGHADILVSRITPRPSLAGWSVCEDLCNAPFSQNELVQVKESLLGIQDTMSQYGEASAEQLDLLSRKLDQIQSAAERLGRQDWIFFMFAVLVNLVIQAAFSDKAGRALFEAVAHAFEWLSQNLLPPLP